VLEAEMEADQLPDVRFVFDDEDGRSRFCGGFHRELAADQCSPAVEAVVHLSPSPIPSLLCGAQVTRV
jgi:hypothetical protein